MIKKSHEGGQRRSLILSRARHTGRRETWGGQALQRPRRQPQSWKEGHRGAGRRETREGHAAVEGAVSVSSDRMTDQMQQRSHGARASLVREAQGQPCQDLLLLLGAGDADAQWSMADGGGIVLHAREEEKERAAPGGRRTRTGSAFDARQPRAAAREEGDPSRDGARTKQLVRSWPGGKRTSGWKATMDESRESGIGGRTTSAG